MIKAVLALHHKVLPPTINVEKPDPDLNLEDSHFYLNTEARPWFLTNDSDRRRAGVSAFGFGGTNFHVVLEEYVSKGNKAFRLTRPSKEVILSTADLPSLEKKVSEALKQISGEEGEEAYGRLTKESRNADIPQHHARVGFVATSREEAEYLLEAALNLLGSRPEGEGWDHPRGLHFRRQGLKEDQKVAALFPGQGSQYVNMGREATINFLQLREAFSAMDDLFQAEGLPPLSEVVYPIPAFNEVNREEQAALLKETNFAQAAIGVLSFGFYNILSEAGFRPDFAAGHSFGELTALWAGGILDDETFLALVKARGQAMAPPDDPTYEAGTMAAVKAPLSEIQKEIQGFPEVSIANQNSDSQTVLAGPRKAVKEVEEYFTQKSYKVTPLPVSAAFHTPLVQHASEPFAKAVEKQIFHQPSFAVYSNTTGEPYPENALKAKEILSNHILHPVIFKDQIENMYRADGRVFVEIGPRHILSNLVDEILDDRPHETVTLNPSPVRSSDHQLRAAALKLKVLGLPLKDIDPIGRKS
jgi:acyl transferase domain-containing protein